MGQQDLLPAMRGDGLNLYNLASAYAVTGQADQVLALLPEALRLDADLVEVSRHDPDLDTFRADPAFPVLSIT